MKRTIVVLGLLFISLAGFGYGQDVAPPKPSAEKLSNEALAEQGAQLGRTTGLRLKAGNKDVAAYQVELERMDALFARAAKPAGDGATRLLFLKASVLLECGAGGRGVATLDRVLALHPKGRWASLALQTKGQYFFVARDVAALEGLVEAGRGAEVPPQVLQSFVAAHAICAAKELALRGRVAELEALIKKARATGLEAAVIELLEAQIKKAALPLGAELPTFAVKDLKGAPLDLAALRGKVVLVDFWATWCGPCMVELPSLVKLHKELKGAGFAVVGVSLDDDLTQLREVLRVQGVEWPQYCDAKGWKNSLARKYRIDSIPATFLLGRDGRIVAKDLRGEALARAVRKALAGE
jgi:thiol-disulfide isomerase/thioredoxin